MKPNKQQQKKTTKTNNPKKTTFIVQQISVLHIRSQYIKHPQTHTWAWNQTYVSFRQTSWLCASTHEGHIKDGSLREAWTILPNDW